MDSQKTLYETVMEPIYNQKSKHGFDLPWLRSQINNMTQYEFLVTLSEALEEMERAKTP